MSASATQGGHKELHNWKRAVTECRVYLQSAHLNALVNLFTAGNNHHNRFQPFFRDHPGETVPEENYWTLWCKGRLTEADTLTIRLGTTPSRLSSAHLHHHHFLRARCPSCRPTNSVKALKALPVSCAMVLRWRLLPVNTSKNVCSAHNPLPSTLSSSYEPLSFSDGSCPQKKLFLPDMRFKLNNQHTSTVVPSLSWKCSISEQVEKEIQWGQMGNTGSPRK